MNLNTNESRAERVRTRLTDMASARAAAKGEGRFTLIELLVVIAILTILAGIVVFAVGNSTENAGIAACETERSSIITAWNAAYTSNLVNDAASQETYDKYLVGGASGLKYFAAPTSTGATRVNATKVLPADCAAIADADLQD